MKYIYQYKSWPKLSWKSDPILPLISRARLEQGKLLSKVSQLGFKLGQEAHIEILIEETVKTAAIEGENISRELVRSSVMKRLGLSSTGLPMATRNVDGLVQVLLDATQSYAKPLTEARLKGWQAALFPTGYSGLTRIKVGDWRGNDPMRVVSGPINREKIHFEAPPRNNLKREIKQFLSWWKLSQDPMEGLLRAGLAHFYFVTIHPFEDGNGRIARAITDMALAQEEQLSTRYYSLSTQIMEERQNYYTVLEMCQKGTGDITPWFEWFLECYIRAVQKSSHLIANVLAKAEFWQQLQTMELNERQKKVINRLLDAGKGAFKGGLTTRKYVSMAKVSRATAFREILDLVSNQILQQNPSRGRSVSYDLNWKLGIEN